MKNTELRIGNYVTFTDETNTIVAISPADFAREFHKGYHFDGYEPIPLTEEWLVKFGFERRQHQQGMHFKYHTVWIGNNRNGRCFILKRTHGRRIRRVKHVHQLQNLYFAITCEELTTK